MGGAPLELMTEFDSLYLLNFLKCWFSGDFNNLLEACRYQGYSVRIAVLCLTLLVPMRFWSAEHFSNIPNQAELWNCFSVHFLPIYQICIIKSCFKTVSAISFYGTIYYHTLFHQLIFNCFLSFCEAGKLTWIHTKVTFKK